MSKTLVVGSNKNGRPFSGHSGNVNRINGNIMARNSSSLTSNVNPLLYTLQGNTSSSANTGDQHAGVFL
jgi:hypothetical protein